MKLMIERLEDLSSKGSVEKEVYFLPGKNGLETNSKQGLFWRDWVSFVFVGVEKSNTDLFHDTEEEVEDAAEEADSKDEDELLSSPDWHLPEITSILNAHLLGGHFHKGITTVGRTHADFNQLVPVPVTLIQIGLLQCCHTVLASQGILDLK